MSVIDKVLYRNALDLYKRWNEAEMDERLQNAGQLSPTEAWHRYVDLWESARKMGLSPGNWQRAEKLAALERYYARLHRLEAWR